MKKILIVDDNASNIEFLRVLLSKVGYGIIEAFDANIAIDLASSEQPSLILMDVMMPTLDGLEALNILRGNEKLKDIPVIAVTAQAMKGDKERILEAGFDDYIAKPINYKELLEKIKKFI